MSIERFEEDEEIYWVHAPEQPSLLGISASRYADDTDWSVYIDALEFVRDDPLEQQLRNSIAAALESVPGVKSVEEEDREVYLVEGTANGDDLVRVGVDALRNLERELNEFMKSGN